MSDAHNPERIRALQGCAELYKIAASHLEADPPNYEEAARAIKMALETGDEIFNAVVLDYVMSGGFQKTAFKNLQEKMDARLDGTPEELAEFRKMYEQTVPPPGESGSETT